MANKKKGKKEIKDSVDVQDIVIENNTKIEKNNEEISQVSRTSFKEFIKEKRIPIYTYIYKLVTVDYKNYKSDPNGMSDNTMLLKDISNKKRFLLKLIYLMFALIIATILLVFSILLLIGVIGDLNPDNAENAYIPGIMMAFAIVIYIFFI